jgi:hypothetical protein
MSINKNNYEAFFLDYHEGNLSPQQVADLLLYIEQHPELREEFESFENVTLEDFSNISFENKSGLKKEITLDNKEEFFIKAVEGTLIPAEKTLLNDFIKQHPQYKTDLELFQKTKLVADNSIVFENKESLKRDLTPTLSTSSALQAPSPKEKGNGVNLFGEGADTAHLLISAVEGLLTSSETALLNQQLAVDPEMQHSLHLYQQTKLGADTSIVFEDKEELKHLTPTLSKGEGEVEENDNRKAIPLFYYVAVAASLLFLFGLYFIFNNNSSKQNFADKKETRDKNQELKENQDASIKNQEQNLAQAPELNNSKTVKKHIATNKNQIVIPENKKEANPIIENNPQPIANNIVPENKIENNPPSTLDKQLPTIKNNQPTTNNEAIAQINKKNENTKSTDYLSIKEIAVEKIKEKTLDENTLASQKKNGRLKRFSLWDVAQITTKGISKLTGRNIEVKPTYNDNGDVTAYALGNGIEMKRGR